MHKLKLRMVPIVLIVSILCNLLTITNSIKLIETSEIVLPQGKLVGAQSLLWKYNEYLGIPYASINGRFQEPGDPPQWEGILRAKSDSIKCSQVLPMLNVQIGREDCLYLNIYTPTYKIPNGHPVMVFIHGGGFYWGSDTDLLYNPRFLIQKGVIVVTLNYRLSAFGFLCLHNKGAPGNVGLKDQVAALRWIQKNIKHFGGNANSVTLFGHSAGSASVNYLVLSPATKGLFHRAIMESGAVLMPLSFDYDPIKSASYAASRMGHNTSDPDELLKIFERASKEDIIRATNKDSLNDAFAPYIFRPCLEKFSTNAIVTAPPKDMLNSVKLDPNFKMIIGYNNKEGIYYAANYKNRGVETLNDHFESIIPSNIRFAADKEKQSFIDEVKKFYFKGSKISVDKADALIDYFSDIIFMFPAIATTETLLATTNATIYNYYFKYDSLRNINKFITDYRFTPGAAHGDELFYLFDPIMYRLLSSFYFDHYVIDRMTSMWTNFAKNGDPMATIGDYEWKRSDKEQLKFLEINNKMQMIDLPNKERIEFWKEMYTKYNNDLY